MRFITKQSIKINGLFMLAFMCLASCQNSSQNNTLNVDQTLNSETVTVKHKLGEIQIQKNPKNIVVLDIGALETLQELGIQPTGIPKKFLPEYLQNLRENSEIKDVGSVIEPDFEAISSLNPHLIFISTRQERYFDELNEIAPTLFIGTDNDNYLPSFEQNVRLMGEIFSKEDLAQKKLDELLAKVEERQEKYKNDSNKALFLIYNNGKFSAYGKMSRFGFIHDVLEIKPVLDLENESVHGQRISNELIAEANPDYLFIVDRNAVVLGKSANKNEIENRLIQQTKAYKNGKIFYLNPDVWFISGGGLTSVNLMIEDVDSLLN